MSKKTRLQLTTFRKASQTTIKGKEATYLCMCRLDRTNIWWTNILNNKTSVEEWQENFRMNNWVELCERLRPHLTGEKNTKPWKRFRGNASCELSAKTLENDTVCAYSLTSYTDWFRCGWCDWMTNLYIGTSWEWMCYKVEY